MPARTRGNHDGFSRSGYLLVEDELGPDAIKEATDEAISGG